MYGSMAAAALTGLIWRSTGTCRSPLIPFSSDARCGSCDRAPPLLQGDDILTRFLSSLCSPRERSWDQVDGRHFQSAHRRRRRLVLVQGSTSLIRRHHIRSRRIVCFRPVTFSLPPVSLVSRQAGACNNKETCTQRKPATLRTAFSSLFVPGNLAPPSHSS